MGHNLMELNRRNLAAGLLNVEHSPASALPPVRILQIGDGNFLRAFADWMIDVANGAGRFNGRVTIAQPLPQGIAERLEAQDGLYTVLLRGVVDGKEVTSRRVVSCVDQAHDPYSQWEAMLATACDPSLRFVISNTTEAGIVFTAEPFIEDACPVGFPAKVTALLFARFKALGAAGGGLVFLPCELIEANGSKLRDCVLQHARNWKLPADFLAWVEAHNVFCNTLVDRIVPGFPAAEAEALYAEFGYRDPLLVAAEPFHLWVIEGPAEVAREFPLHEVGLDVVWTDDLKPYRTRKVRILNGAHTASSLAAFSAGLDTVKSMTEDPVVSKYLDKVMFEEIVPFVPLPDAERKAYAKTIVERFANPFIRHELISIALNSVSKWQVRVLPTLKDYVAQHGRAAAGLSFSLAALLHFYDGEFGADDDFFGRRDGKPYPIRDDAQVLARIDATKASKSVHDKVKTLLADHGLWGEDLTGIAGLVEQTAAALEKIRSQGVRAAMAAV